MTWFQGACVQLCDGTLPGMESPAFRANFAAAFTPSNFVWLQVQATLITMKRWCKFLISFSTKTSFFEDVERRRGDTFTDCGAGDASSYRAGKMGTSSCTSNVGAVERGS